MAPERLICLANSLKQRYADRKSIYCEIFTDRKVAGEYVLLTDLEPLAGMARRTTFMHAAYAYDRDYGERIYIDPDPLQTRGASATETIIHLQVQGLRSVKSSLMGDVCLCHPRSGRSDGRPIWRATMAVSRCKVRSHRMAESATFAS